MTSNNRTITLHVIPKASANQIVGWVDDADGSKILKIKVTAVPEHGKANKAVLALLARHWKCPPRELELALGTTSRHKHLKILSSALYAHIMETMS